MDKKGDNHIDIPNTGVHDGCELCGSTEKLCYYQMCDNCYEDIDNKSNDRDTFQEVIMVLGDKIKALRSYLVIKESELNKLKSKQ